MDGWEGVDGVLGDSDGDEPAVSADFDPDGTVSVQAGGFWTEMEFGREVESSVTSVITIWLQTPADVEIFGGMNFGFGLQNINVK